MKQPSYATLQKRWLKNTGLKVGDKVLVIATAKPYQNGWQADWLKDMDEWVGQRGMFFADRWENGIAVAHPLLGRWVFPFFVLAPVED